MSDGVLAERYAAVARSGGIVADAAQQAALDRLERLRGEQHKALHPQQAKTAAKGRFTSLFSL